MKVYRATLEELEGMAKERPFQLDKNGRPFYFVPTSVRRNGQILLNKKEIAHLKAKNLLT